MRSSVGMTHTGWTRRFSIPLLCVLAIFGCGRSRKQTPQASASSQPASAPSVHSSATGSSDSSAWRQLIAMGRVLVDPDTPETCEEEERPHVLIVDGANPSKLMAVALRAGCRALGGSEGDDDPGPFPGRPICCPVGLPAPPALATGGGKSCARALVDQVAAGVADAAQPPPVSTGNNAGLLNTGTFLADCAVPPTTAAVICAAAVRGRAQGVSVALVPFDASLAGCVASRIRALPFPESESMNVTITRFAPDPF